MNSLKSWSSPELKAYGTVENITEQVGSVTKTGGTGDTISITVAGNSTVVASGAAAGSSLINISPGATFGGPC